MREERDGGGEGGEGGSGGEVSKGEAGSTNSLIAEPCHSDSRRPGRSACGNDGVPTSPPPAGRPAATSHASVSLDPS